MIVLILRLFVPVEITADLRFAITLPRDSSGINDSGWGE